MRLVAVRLRKGEQRLDAFVRDERGKAYKIPYKWLAKEKTDVAPASWCDTVKAEFDQRNTVVTDVLSAFRKRT